MHDIESRYRKELAKAQKSVVLRTLQRLESSKFKYIEKRIDDNFDEVWFISKDELESFKPKLSIDKGVYLPMPAIDLAPFPPKAKSKIILYVGDLHLKNNYHSLEWFIFRVFPRIRDKDKSISLNVIGNIDEEDKPKLAKNGVELLGYVDDLESYYKQSSCFVCPVLFGAGVKVKTIDALSKGMIVVTTRKGVEGTDLEHGKHLFVSDDANEMANLIVDIAKNGEKYETIRSNGYLFVKKYHSIEHQAKLIESTFGKFNYD